MAQRTVITLVDDINGEVIEAGAGQTVSFALDGTAYEIDLTDGNAQSLRDALEPYLSKARKAGRAPAAKASSSARRGKQDLAVVREWLRGRGHSVSDRGRIPAALIEEYQAHSGN